MKLDRQLSKYYYTAAQARKVLGLDEEAFQYWVRKKRINKVTLPERKQGVYSRREVDEIANKVEATLLAEQAEGAEFRKAMLEDIDQESELANLVFGEGARLYRERKTFLEKNSNIDYHVYDLDKLMAYITIIPFKHEIIRNYIEGSIKNIYETETDTIEQFEPGKPLECILVDMITTPTVPPRQRGAYGAKLLSGLAKELAEMGRRGVEITKLYATSRTPTGIRILKHAGFRVIQHDEKNNRYSFELDVTNSDEKLLREYKQALMEWKEQQSSSTRRTRKNL